MGEKKPLPFSVFGKRIQKLRTKAQETLLEVSGAVEIDVATLEKIEAGSILPDEEILMLLISHFEVQDSDAVKLWELAGYSRFGEKEAPVEEQIMKQIMMVIPMDNRVVFSDSVHINAKETGVIITFGQSSDTSQPQSISRIGMSVVQAKNLLVQLADSLHKLDAPGLTRSLPAPKNKKEQTEKKKSA